MIVYSYIATLIVALAMSLILSPIAIKIGQCCGIVSKSKDIEIDRPPVSNLGGFAVLLSIAAGILAAYLIYRPAFSGYGRISLGIGIGTAIMVVMGYIDDRRDLRAGTKFIIQIVAALITAILGVRIATISNPFDSVFDLGALSIPATVLWIVGVTNAVNMVDGMDGLATGVLSIAGLTLSAICISLGLPFVSIIFLALFGATIGFLHFNYPPARIILGNVGAYSLGYIIATASIVQPVKVPTAVVMFVPMFALGLPILEMVITVSRRILKRKKIYQGDTEHLHHLLLALGFSPSVADWIFYCVSFLFATVAVALAVGNRKLTIVFLACLLLIFSILTVKLALSQRRKEGS